MQEPILALELDIEQEDNFQQPKDKDFEKEDYHETDLIYDKLSITKCYECDENSYNQVSQALHSLQMGKEIINSILKQAAQQVLENYYDSQLSGYSVEWVDHMQDIILGLDNIVQDDQMCELPFQGLSEEIEPPLNHQDHWHRYNIDVAIKGIKPPDSDNVSIRSNLSRFSLRTQAKVMMSHATSQHSITKLLEEEKKKTSTKFEVRRVHTELEFKDMTQIIEQDTLENGLRAAYERELYLLRLKELADKQRVDDLKQQQIQLKKLNGDLSGKNTYTFDYDGRILLQGMPIHDKLPEPIKKINYEVQQLEKNMLYKYLPNDDKETQSKKVRTLHVPVKEKETFFKDYPSLASNVDSLTLERGVTLYNGNQKKQGPLFTNENMLKMNPAELSLNLTNPNLGLRLTQNEYKTIIKGTEPQSIISGLHQQKSVDFLQKQFLPDSINSSIITKNINQSILANNQGQRYANNSISGSIKSIGNGGQIKLNLTNESNIEEMFSYDTVNQNNYSEKSMLHNDTGNQKLPSLNTNNIETPTTKFQIDLMTSRDWGENIENSNKTKSFRLPQTKSTHSNLPVLAKFPRERLSILAKKNVTNQKRLAPPNVGKVFGHSYKGYPMINQ